MSNCSERPLKSITFVWGRRACFRLRSWSWVFTALKRLTKGWAFKWDSSSGWLWANTKKVFAGKAHNPFVTMCILLKTNRLLTLSCWWVLMSYLISSWVLSGSETSLVDSRDNKRVKLDNTFGSVYFLSVLSRVLDTRSLLILKSLNWELVAIWIKSLP